MHIPYRLLATGIALLGLPNLAFAQTDTSDGEMAYVPSEPTPPPPQPSAPAPEPVADAAAAPAPEPRKIVFSAPPAPESNDGESSRGFHYHDGFYTRLGINYGITGGGFAVGRGDDQRRLDYSGSQLDLDLLVGGTPSNGIAVGGGLLMGALLQPDMEEGNQRGATRNVPVLLIGPFVRSEEHTSELQSRE